MSTKQLIIAAATLFSIGVIVVLITTVFFDKPKSDNNLTVEKAIESANNEVIGDQDLKQTAKNIVQSGIVKSNTSNTTTAISDSPLGISSEFDEYRTFTDFEKEVELEKYKVDTLLDGSIVYSVSRENIKTLKLESKFYNIDLSKSICANRCTIIKTKMKYIVADLGLYYLSSFRTNDKIYWLGFIKNDQGYTFAQISEPEFRNAKTENFIDENITKINQKGQNSSEYSFNIKDQNSRIIDFKNSVTLLSLNNDNVGDD
ncbi:MAG: hypothetical protein H7196_04495 [candidate division SR1 bacterium]|nr:hypothetical protein [candidate division SR1 bacterium]